MDTRLPSAVPGCVTVGWRVLVERHSLLFSLARRWRKAHLSRLRVPCCTPARGPLTAFRVSRMPRAHLVLQAIPLRPKGRARKGGKGAAPFPPFSFVAIALTLRAAAQSQRTKPQTKARSTLQCGQGASLRVTARQERKKRSRKKERERESVEARYFITPPSHQQQPGLGRVEGARGQSKVQSLPRRGSGTLAGGAKGAQAHESDDSLACVSNFFMFASKASARP